VSFFIARARHLFVVAFLFFLRLSYPFWTGTLKPCFSQPLSSWLCPRKTYVRKLFPRQYLPLLFNWCSFWLRKLYFPTQEPDSVVTCNSPISQILPRCFPPLFLSVICLDFPVERSTQESPATAALSFLYLCSLISVSLLSQIVGLSLPRHGFSLLGYGRLLRDSIF